jgi:hypothetical protein
VVSMMGRKGGNVSKSLWVLGRPCARAFEFGFISEETRHTIFVVLFVNYNNTAAFVRF